MPNSSNLCVTRSEGVQDVIVVVASLLLSAAAVARGRCRPKVHVVKLLLDRARLKHSGGRAISAVLLVFFHSAG